MAFALLEVWTLFDLLLAKVLSGVTPAAKRNTYSVAILVGYLTQGSVLSPATLGCVIATPTELPRVRTIHYKLHFNALPKQECVNAEQPHYD